MSDCGSSCSGCPSASGCGGGQTQEPESLQVPANPNSNVKKVIAVVSGKGGVGKSLVTSLLASAMRRTGASVGILDADITGPSIPKSFGLENKAYGTAEGVIPPKTKTGIDVMSVNLILQEESDPVLWRGPIIASIVQQFWTDVVWKDIDYLFIDMPPGTGDVPLTVFQALPVDGIVIVTSPQELVTMIVDKAYKMAKMMDVPILGIVENMSYFHCPDNGKDYHIFGESDIDEIARVRQLDTVAKIPIDPAFTKLVDAGAVEDIEQDWLNPVLDAVKKA